MINLCLFSQTLFSLDLSLLFLLREAMSVHNEHLNNLHLLTSHRVKSIACSGGNKERDRYATQTISLIPRPWCSLAFGKLISLIGSHNVSRIQ